MKLQKAEELYTPGIPFVPSLRENRENAPEDQFAVSIDPITEGEFKRFKQRGLTKGIRAGTDAGQVAEAQSSQTEEIIRFVFEKKIREVHNFFDFQGLPITTGAALFELCETPGVLLPQEREEFYAEIVQACTNPGAQSAGFTLGQDWQRSFGAAVGKVSSTSGPADSAP